MAKTAHRPPRTSAPSSPDDRGVFLPPLKPHRKLFYGGLALLAILAGALLVIRLTSIEQPRTPVQQPHDAAASRTSG